VTSVARWVRSSRWWLTIVPPYVAIIAVAAVGLGVYRTQAAQAELRARDAVLAADLAAETAAEAQEETVELEREAERSCEDRKAARADVDDVFRTIGAALPPRIALQIQELLSDRPPIIC
jgi:predicted  nucleic acid-binding Zn-ribbon protein